MEEFLSPCLLHGSRHRQRRGKCDLHQPGTSADDLTLYTTLAHEGYPGHLYQNVYYDSTDPAPIRSLLSFGGYTEGWATYVEMLSYYFTDMDADRALLEQKNASVILGLYALADMGIHYDGWTLTETVAFFRSFGITDTDTVREIFDLILADPGNYLKLLHRLRGISRAEEDCLRCMGRFLLAEKVSQNSAGCRTRAF